MLSILGHLVDLTTVLPADGVLKELAKKRTLAFSFYAVSLFVLFSQIDVDFSISGPLYLFYCCLSVYWQDFARHRTQFDTKDLLEQQLISRRIIYKLLRNI